jgi:hypothetical protein
LENLTDEYLAVFSSHQAGAGAQMKKKKKKKSSPVEFPRQALTPDGKRPKRKLVK